MVAMPPGMLRPLALGAVIEVANAKPKSRQNPLQEFHLTELSSSTAFCIRSPARLGRILEGHGSCIGSYDLMMGI